MFNPNFYFHFHGGQPILEQDGGGLAIVNIANKSKIIVKVGYLRRSDKVLYIPRGSVDGILDFFLSPSTCPSSTLFNPSWIFG